MESIFLTSFPVLLAALVGFGHAFEADHVLAMSTLISRSDNKKQLILKGLMWGLGHASILFVFAIILIFLRLNYLTTYFEYLELLVGIMLIALGSFRLWQHYSNRPVKARHKEAYGVGLIHGLGGSAAVILLAVADISSNGMAMVYLTLFALGSLGGMAVVAYLLQLPLLGNKGANTRRMIFTWFSSLLCIIYGGVILFQVL